MDEMHAIRRMCIVTINDKIIKKYVRRNLWMTAIEDREKKEKMHQ